MAILKAIYTTTGMYLMPYKPSKMGMILNARSVWVPGGRVRSPVTAHLMKGPDDNFKTLVTYKCHPNWLKEQIPEIEIENLPPNHVEDMEYEYTLKPDVIPNEVQVSAVEAVLDNNFKHAFFNMPTGVGKTLLSAYLASILKKKAWAMCYRAIVLDQWKSTMENMTTFDTKRLYRVKSSAALLRMATGDWPYEKYDMYVSTPMILTKFATDYGLELLNDVFNNCGIGVKFFDEAHKNVGNICKINGLTNVERTYYLSADFNQAEPNKTKLYYKMFSSVPVIKPRKDESDNLKYTIGVVVRYNTHPSFNEIEGCFQKYGFSAFKYMEYQIMQQEFYDAFAGVLDEIRRSTDWRQYKILILANLIEHTNVIFDWVKNYVNSYCRDDPPYVVRFHSEVGAEERKDALENGEIICSTYQSMGVGVDIKLIRHVIGLAPVNPIEDNQAAGRARALPDGKDCFYYLFQDDGFKYTQQRLPERISYLMQQKIKRFCSIKYS